ncbi:MAG: ornithine carbamoyltransferase [Deltaproteobacteria bacterium]|jgi:ornithine carbamoyltransferase|nr:ornithine carbamoyltransferase [Deltaproteobacteria bacterium]
MPEPRHFITFRDLSLEEHRRLIRRAMELKAERAKGNYRLDHLAGRTVLMMFSKSSTRTRVSFECAVSELGGHPLSMSLGDSQWARGEPLSHTARVLSRYVSCVVIRHTLEADLVELSKWSSVPIVNALTDERHPCQVLGDLMTVAERTGGPDALASKSFCWIGDGDNMLNTWLEASAVFGFPLRFACPPGYGPDKAILERATRDNPRITCAASISEAARGADVVTTDVFASMGREAQREKRLADFKGYQVNAELMASAAPGAIFLHCLPAHPGEEVSEEVIESPASAVWDEAENRLHAQKALLEYLIPPLAKA